MQARQDMVVGARSEQVELRGVSKSFRTSRGSIGGLASLLALLSGTWFPLGHGFLHDIAQFLPSYWLVQASHVSLGGHGWAASGWLVIAAWTAVLATLAGIAYRRDTARV